MPTIYAVASAKGGVGKTTTAANLAATLAAAGFETVAVDGDIGTANLAPALGLEVPEDGATLHDVLAGEADPVDATYRGPHGLAVMPGDESLDAFRSADPSRIREVLGSITNADYVVVDTGAGLTHESALPLSLADGVLLVSTPTRDALTDTRKTVELAGKLDGAVAGLALTRVGPDDTLESALEAAGMDAEGFDAAVLGRVPEDATVAEALAAGEPLSEHAPGSDPAAAYRSLASSLTDEPIRPPLSYEVEEGEQEPTTPGDESAPVGSTDGTSSGSAAVESDADAEPATDAESDADVENGPSPEATDAVEDVDAKGADDAEDGSKTEDAPETEDTPEAGETADGTEATDDDIEALVGEAEMTEGVEDEPPSGVEDDTDADSGEAPDADPGEPSDADAPDEATEADATADETGTEQPADHSDDSDRSGDSDDAVSDDAVIIEGEADEREDEAAAAARRTVLDEDERGVVDGDASATTADADADDPEDIDDDAIPFAASESDGAAESSGENVEEEDDTSGGFLSRLFR